MTLVCIVSILIDYNLEVYVQRKNDPIFVIRNIVNFVNINCLKQ